MLVPCRPVPALRLPTLAHGAFDLAKGSAFEESALFSEPGIFLGRPDKTLHVGANQAMPFARPHFDKLLEAIDFAIARDYPARREFTGAV